MKAFRNLLTGHRHFAVLLLAMTLALKALVPGGYMLSSQHAALTVQICSGTLDAKSVTVTVPLKHDGQTDDHSNAAKECPFTALSMNALSGADPLIIVMALAFILALGFAPTTPLRLVRAAFLSPPSRAPPVIS